MSKLDTKKLGNVIGNVFEEVKMNTTGNLSVTTELRIAQIIATGTIVATLIREEKEIYHDH